MTTPQPLYGQPGPPPPPGSVPPTQKSRRVWCHVQVLLAGALLTPAQRTVTAALRVVGLGETPQFQRYCGGS